MSSLYDELLSIKALYTDDGYETETFVQRTIMQVTGPEHTNQDPKSTDHPNTEAQSSSPTALSPWQNSPVFGSAQEPNLFDSPALGSNNLVSRSPINDVPQSSSNDTIVRFSLTDDVPRSPNSRSSFFPDTSATQTDNAGDNVLSRFLEPEQTNPVSVHVSFDETKEWNTDGQLGFSDVDSPMSAFDPSKPIQSIFPTQGYKTLCPPKPRLTVAYKSIKPPVDAPSDDDGSDIEDAQALLDFSRPCSPMIDDSAQPVQPNAVDRPCSPMIDDSAQPVQPAARPRSPTIVDSAPVRPTAVARPGVDEHGRPHRLPVGGKKPQKYAPSTPSGDKPQRMSIGGKVPRKAIALAEREKEEDERKARAKPPRAKYIDDDHGPPLKFKPYVVTPQVKGPRKSAKVSEIITRTIIDEEATADNTKPKRSEVDEDYESSSESEDERPKKPADIGLPFDKISERWLAELRQKIFEVGNDAIEYFSESMQTDLLDGWKFNLLRHSSKKEHNSVRNIEFIIDDRISSIGINPHWISADRNCSKANLRCHMLHHLTHVFNGHQEHNEEFDAIMIKLGFDECDRFKSCGFYASTDAKCKYVQCCPGDPVLDFMPCFLTYLSRYRAPKVNINCKCGQPKSIVYPKVLKPSRSRAKKRKRDSDDEEEKPKRRKRDSDEEERHQKRHSKSKPKKREPVSEEVSSDEVSDSE